MPGLDLCKIIRIFFSIAREDFRSFIGGRRKTMVDGLRDVSVPCNNPLELMDASPFTFGNHCPD
jgi:hypothetical protein